MSKREQSASASDQETNSRSQDVARQLLDKFSKGVGELRGGSYSTEAWVRGIGGAASDGPVVTNPVTKSGQPVNKEVLNGLRHDEEFVDTFINNLQQASEGHQPEGPYGEVIKRLVEAVEAPETQVVASVGYSGATGNKSPDDEVASLLFPDYRSMAAYDVPGMPASALVAIAAQGAPTIERDSGWIERAPLSDTKELVFARHDQQVSLAVVNAGEAFPVAPAQESHAA
jgi:hypothetical protein